MRFGEPGRLGCIRRIAAVSTAATVLTVAGCDSAASTNGDTSATSLSPSTVGSASTTTVAVSTSLDAATGLHDEGLPVVSVVVYDEDTDPGHQLGTGNGYDSRAAFADARLTPGVAATDQQGDLTVGGTVEVYPYAAVAAANADPARQPDPRPGEHDLVSGNVVLRLAPRLTPAEVDAYRIGLQQVTGRHAVTVS